jgi:hypothetical protein
MSVVWTAALHKSLSVILYSYPVRKVEDNWQPILHKEYKYNWWQKYTLYHVYFIFVHKLCCWWPQVLTETFFSLLNI